MAALGLLHLVAAMLWLTLGDQLAAYAQRQYVDGNSSFMRLDSLGYNFSPFAPANFHNKTRIAISGLDGQSYFYPILSSPSFDLYWNSSVGPLKHGFSVGFYHTCSAPTVNCRFYLAVCAGSLGSTASGSWESISYVLFFESGDGFVVPVWFANLNDGIFNYWGYDYEKSASLVLVAQHHTSGASTVKELQLQDGNDGKRVLWKVPDAALMQVSDSGEFIVYNSNKERVFQAPNVTDTLVQGQRLSVGMQLTSNNSAYSATMEKGGLALYLNSMRQQGTEQAAPPYWAFPFFRDPDPNAPHPTMNQLLHSSPPSCSDQYPPYVYVSHSASYGHGQCVFEFGSCSSTVSYLSIEFFIPDSAMTYFNARTYYFSFLQLQNDGKLYLTIVNNGYPFHTSIQFFKTALDSDDMRSVVPSMSNPSAGHLLEGITGLMGVSLCDTPLCCGPLGVCTPDAPTMCACPNHSSFEPVNKTDLTQGCKRLTGSQYRPFNMCGAGTTFVELKSIANIFLMTGWTFDSTGLGDMSARKQACSSDCSCEGISFQNSTSTCFLITQNISLLSIPRDQNFLIWNYTASSDETLESKLIVRKDDYVTHLKVASESTRSKFPPFTLAVIIPFCIVMCFFLGLGIMHLRKRRRRALQQAKEEEELHDILPLLPTRFSYKELAQATKGFSKLLGSGACGSVYKGTLLDGREVAVKVLEGVLQAGGHQAREFLAEIATVGRTGHHNIVRLVGFCWQISHRILVYEFVERGSLDRWLFGQAAKGSMSCTSVLDWRKRYNIVLGIARGLHYLHEDCEQPILHADIKPQNILLSKEFVAKISDFGMSRLMQREMQSCVMTGVRGTPGYIAPEWFCHGSVSRKSDIYSLGIVMLEIVAGRKVLEFSWLNNTNTGKESSSSTGEEAWHLPSWAAKKWEQGCLMDIVDPRLLLEDCAFDEKEAQRLLYTALWCIHEDPALRPHAATIIHWLESHESDINVVPQPPYDASIPVPIRQS